MGLVLEPKGDALRRRTRLLRKKILQNLFLFRERLRHVVVGPNALLPHGQLPKPHAAAVSPSPPAHLSSRTVRERNTSSFSLFALCGSFERKIRSLLGQSQGRDDAVLGGLTVLSLRIDGFGYSYRRSFRWGLRHYTVIIM